MNRSKSTRTARFTMNRAVHAPTVTRVLLLFEGSGLAFNMPPRGQLASMLYFLAIALFWLVLLAGIATLQDTCAGGSADGSADGSDDGSTGGSTEMMGSCGMALSKACWFALWLPSCWPAASP
ncbi:hypothetical protein HaLaN_19880 [Haematococcus lacustris]|uniref:Uncharacterized protein n=1 Tax=Haematococcus lacustris TaxID=44745 RepID=A0A699ZI57_HAELA|nr:hypothetical protein HaLaN_19880 [Haematococcus lacustris]